MILRIWQTPKFTVSKFGNPGNILLRFGDFSRNDYYLEANVSCAYPLTKVNSITNLPLPRIHLSLDGYFHKETKTIV